MHPHPGSQESNTVTGGEQTGDIWTTSQDLEQVAQDSAKAAAIHGNPLQFAPEHEERSKWSIHTTVLVYNPLSTAVISFVWKIHTASLPIRDRRPLRHKTTIVIKMDTQRIITICPRARHIDQFQAAFKAMSLKRP